MSLKYKVGDLVRTTTTVSLGYQSFPIGSEATVHSLIPRASTPYPYMIMLTQYQREVAVAENEIEFVNAIASKAKPAPIYRKFIGNSKAANWYIVEDNHGTHFIIIDTSDALVRVGSKHNKDMFVHFKEDTSFDINKFVKGKPVTWSLQDAFDDMVLPMGQGNKQDTGCQHKWQAYTGLSESFEFCITCDAKRHKKVSA
jgi:hypothetical protein